MCPRVYKSKPRDLIKLCFNCRSVVVTRINDSNRNEVASTGATRSGLIPGLTYPGLKQPWALRRNRFALGYDSLLNALLNL